MATKAKVQVSKSAQMRTMFENGSTIVEVQNTLHVGYAFAYGVAKRGGYALTAASRRKAKTVATTDSGSIEITTQAGVIVIVDPVTAKVTRRKIK